MGGAPRLVRAAVIVVLVVAASASPGAADDAVDQAKAIDPDTLVVGPPDALESRKPEVAVGKLLRVELSILEALETLELQLGQRTTELKRLRAQQEVVETDLERTTVRFDELTARLASARELVRRRLEAMIQLKRTEPYQILFSSESYASFLRRRRALTALLADDRRRIRSYREQLAGWEVARDDLERRRLNLANTQATIANLIQDVTWDREEKELLLRAVRERVAYHSKLEQEMADVDEGLREKVQELRDTSLRRLQFEENKGRMSMPIWRGEIIGRFGVRTHPEFGTRTVHRGIDVVPKAWDGEREVKVRAIYWGFVAYAGMARGLGRTLIIDHTGGYMSLYGHLDRIDVALGAKVKTGQVIGTMGDSGSLQGSRLYLEVRKDGQAIDPARWLR